MTEYIGRVRIEEGASLRINLLRAEDQGWYECRVLFLDRHSTDADFQNGTWIHLTVNAPPTFLETPPAFVEVRNGTLSIAVVERASAGTYTCHASSEEGTITHTTRVLVQGPPIIVVPPQNVTVNISQDAFLACQAEAYPGNLTYTWFQGSSNVFHLSRLQTRVRVLVDGSLLLQRTTPDDAGKYTCIPSNGLWKPPSASAFVTLPGWSVRPDGSIVIATGNDDALGVYTCTPYNSYGTAGESQPTRVLLKDPPAFTVRPKGEYFQEVGRELVIPCHGVWECTATNQVASVSTTTSVHVLGTSPHAVTNVSVLPLLLAANVSWEPGFDGGYFQRFSVWYTPLVKHPPRAHHDWVSLSVPVGAQHLLVENLQPDMSYQFSVLAQNKLGSGPFSQIDAFYEFRLVAFAGSYISDPSNTVNVSTAGMEVYPSRTQLPELLPQPVLAGVIGGICFLSVAVIFSTMAACIMNRRRAARIQKRRQDPPLVFSPSKKLLPPHNSHGSGSPDSTVKLKLQPSPYRSLRQTLLWGAGGSLQHTGQTLCPDSIDTCANAISPPATAFLKPPRLPVGPAKASLPGSAAWPSSPSPGASPGPPTQSAHRLPAGGGRTEAVPSTGTAEPSWAPCGPLDPPPLEKLPRGSLTSQSSGRGSASFLRPPSLAPSLGGNCLGTPLGDRGSWHSRGSVAEEGRARMNPALGGTGKRRNTSVDENYEWDAEFALESDILEALQLYRRVQIALCYPLPPLAESFQNPAPVSPFS
ncbi:PREDICTED: protein turtle homolog A [Pygoscelis adeliae]|uniref:protein turtle homolog A n=1 Tax=Pygoscelis adeliae TaxID=9238 RepID=UPI0004F50A7E|nr:PREDICTED: protein turtle homolog A [Pygoscelis adeliae]